MIIGIFYDTATVSNELEEAATWLDTKEWPCPTLMYYTGMSLHSLSYLGLLKYETEVRSASLHHLMPHSQAAVVW